MSTSGARYEWVKFNVDVKEGCAAQHNEKCELDDIGYPIQDISGECSPLFPPRAPAHIHQSKER
jgi:hypothetical protein